MLLPYSRVELQTISAAARVQPPENTANFALISISLLTISTRKFIILSVCVDNNYKKERNSMTKREERSEKIRKFILEEVDTHPGDITNLVMGKFEISRQASWRHINNLVEEGLLEAKGNTRAREYSSKPLGQIKLTIAVSAELEEDEVWRNEIDPLMNSVNQNIKSICQYGFTEMLNNVIAHSSATNVTIEFSHYTNKIKFVVNDDGIGIFDKIQKELRLSDKRHAILELAKGKLTTDPVRHTGEGIFFTSRVFDEFSIISGGLYFSHSTDGDDWLLEAERKNSEAGTAVFLEIDPESERTLTEVFDKFSGDGDYGFTKTHVPVALAKYGDENLVSRSQARRLLTRFDRFREVFLDFEGVDTIGQAFADEIFRVFQNENPEIRITWRNESEQIRKTILRAKSREQE